jgi:2-polyprenyl-3-methyl-5-hydroxy-6-metoxy-1,4-benzoquinol methylase
MTTDLRISPWLADRLACPYDHLSLERTDDALRCANGHVHRIICGIPVLLRDDVEETHWHATQARQASDAGYPSSSTNGINDYVQQAIAATGGFMYVPLAGRLVEYPIPETRLPPGAGRSLLDLGCNWGRWTIAAGRAGYRVVGIDPSLPAIQAAYDVAEQLGVRADFIVGDARFLPFADGAFDTIFSYSVLQHFSKNDVRHTLAECARVLSQQGFSLIQMANKLGARSFVHQARRRFREPSLFQVRYWTPSELQAAFTALIGPSTISVDGFFSLNAQPREAHLLPARFRAVVRISETLRTLCGRMPALKNVADSVYVESHKADAGPRRD